MHSEYHEYIIGCPLTLLRTLDTILHDRGVLPSIRQTRWTEQGTKFDRGTGKQNNNRSLRSSENIKSLCGARMNKHLRRLCANDVSRAVYAHCRSNSSGKYGDGRIVIHIAACLILLCHLLCSSVLGFHECCRRELITDHIIMSDPSSSRTVSCLSKRPNIQLHIQLLCDAFDTSIAALCSNMADITCLRSGCAPFQSQSTGRGNRQISEGYDSKTCPLDRTTITLHPSPTRPKALTRPAGIPRLSTSSMTERALPPDVLSQICRQVALFPFTGVQGLSLQLEPLTVQPGLYVVSVTANIVIEGLYIYDIPHEVPLHGGHLPPPPPAQTQVAHLAAAEVNNNEVNIGLQFPILTPVRLTIVLRTRGPNASGELALFKIGPRGYRGPSL